MEPHSLVLFYSPFIYISSIHKDFFFFFLISSFECDVVWYFYFSVMFVLFKLTDQFWLITNLINMTWSSMLQILRYKYSRHFNFATFVINLWFNVINLNVISLFVDFCFLVLAKWNLCCTQWNLPHDLNEYITFSQNKLK